MTQTIRMYDSPATAEAVKAALEGRSLSPEYIQIFTRPEAPADLTQTLVKTLVKAGIPPAHAALYAEHIGRGEALVVTQPPFGAGQTTANVMLRFKPVPVDLPLATALPTAGRDPATPLSSALGLPVLSADPAPLSALLNWPPLKASPRASKTLKRIQRQSQDPAPLSRKLRLPLLSGNPAPLSTSAKLAVLSGQAAILSQALGWRTLWHNPAPLSAKLKWRALLSNPAPLSRLLGLPVLTKKD